MNSITPELRVKSFFIEGWKNDRIPTRKHEISVLFLFPLLPNEELQDSISPVFELLTARNPREMLFSLFFNLCVFLVVGGVGWGGGGGGDKLKGSDLLG